MNLNSSAQAKQYLLQKGYFYNESDTCQSVEYFPGLFICSTIALDEDPAEEIHYLVTKNGTIYHNTEIAKAVRELGIFPESEKQALNMAVQLITIANPRVPVILEPDSLKQHPAKTSNGIKAKDVKAPQVNKKKGYYEVVLFTFTPQENLPFLDFEVSEARYNQHVVKLGKGICEVW